MLGGDAQSRVALAHPAGNPWQRSEHCPSHEEALPAEKVSCTCSSTISRAMKSCFSLKRPLYSSSAFLSCVANLQAQAGARHTLTDPHAEGVQAARA